MKEFELGQSIRLSASFADSAGAAADPSTITFSYGLRAAAPPPDPTATSLVFGTDAAVIKDATGRFHADVTPDTPGIYSVRVVGTGTVAAAVVGAFRVRPSPFA